MRVIRQLETASKFFSSFMSLYLKSFATGKYDCAYRRCSPLCFSNVWFLEKLPLLLHIEENSLASFLTINHFNDWGSYVTHQQFREFFKLVAKDGTVLYSSSTLKLLPEAPR